MRKLLLLVMMVSWGISAMDSDDDVARGIAELEAGESSRSGRTLDDAHKQLAQQAMEYAQYRQGGVDDEDDEPALAAQPRRLRAGEERRVRRRSTKKRKQVITRAVHDASGSGHVAGLDELEDGVGIVSSPTGELTVEQVNDALCNQLNGFDLPGFGHFNMDDQKEREGMLGLLKLLKATDPDRYDSIAGSIKRGRHRKTNKELVAVLGAIKHSIDAMNADSSRLAAEGNMVSRAQFDEQVRANHRTEMRYRWGICWTIVGGTVTLVATNLINYFMNHVSPDELAQMCEEMGNLTVSQ